jgi:hypothetical protein
MACSSCQKRGTAIASGLSAARSGDMDRAKLAASYVAESFRRDAAAQAQRASAALARLKARVTGR